MVKKTYQEQQEVDIDMLTDFLNSIKNHNSSVFSYFSRNNNHSIYDYSDVVSFSVKTGGSSGGHWDGGRASPFYINSDERVSELTSDIGYLIGNNLSQSTREKHEEDIRQLAENYVSHEVESYSDYGDYYGNGSDYIIIAIDLNEFLKKILEPELFIESQEIVNQFVQETSAEIKQKQLQQQYDTLVQNISAFEKNKMDEFTSINKEIERLKNTLTQLEKKAQKFEKEKDKQLKTMLDKKDELEAIGIILSSPHKKLTK